MSDVDTYLGSQCALTEWDGDFLRASNRPIRPLADLLNECDNIAKYNLWDSLLGRIWESK